MKESINANKKGVSDVKKKSGGTILYTPNFLDVQEADVVRPGREKVEWDDFMLMGDSNREEAEYIGPDSEEANEVAEQTHGQWIGRKISKIVPIDAVSFKAA